MEEIDAVDYQEVSSMGDTVLGEVNDIQDSFEGDTKTGEITETTSTNSEEDTLEKVAGYDYSMTEAEVSTHNQDSELTPLDAYYGSFGDSDLVNLLRSESAQK